MFQTIAPSYQPKLFPKAIPQNYFLKLFPKAPVQSNYSSMLLQSRKVAPHICCPKLLSKVATESRIPKKLPETPKLLPEAASKLFRKAVQSSSPKLLHKAVPRRCSPRFSKAVAPKLRFCKPVHKITKMVPQSYSAKICKAALESCAPKLLPKAALRSCL